MPQFDLLPLLLPALVLGVFTFVVLRQRGQWSLTLRVLGGVKLSRGGPQVCPHLGTTDDPFLHRELPSEEHRCYLWMQRDRIDLTHQKGFCLSAAHAHCPWLSIRPASAPAPLYRRAGTAVAGGIRQAASVYGPEIRMWARIITAAFRAMVRRGWEQVRTVWFPWLARTTRAKLHWALQRADIAETFLRARAATWGIQMAQAWRMVRGFGARAGGHTIAVLRSAATWPGRMVAQTQERRRKQRELAAALRAEARLAQSTVVPAPQPRPAPTIKESSATAAPLAAQPSALDALVVGERVRRLMEQGKLAGMAGDRQLAYQQFQQATALAPDHEEAWLWRAATSEDMDEKRICLEQALSLNPTNTRARSGLVELTDAPPVVAAPAPAAASADVPVSAPLELPVMPAPAVPVPTIPIAASVAADPTSLLERGRTALETGDEDGAYRWFVAATEAAPQDSRTWFWRAKTATEIGEVVRCLEHALTTDPDNEQLRANLAWAVQRQEREQRRPRYGQALGPSAAQAVLDQARQQSAPVTPSPVAQVRTGLANLLRQAAGLACLALSGYWLLAALTPVLPPEALPLPGIVRDLIPAVPWDQLPWPEPLQDLLPGYRLLAGLPHTLAFLALFAGLGLLNRQQWSPPWALALALITMGAALVPGAHPLAVPVTTLLAGLVALGWLTNRGAFSGPAYR